MFTVFVQKTFGKYYIGMFSRLTGNMKNTNQKTSTLLSLSAEPDGPPMDVILQPVTSQSIRVTWKVK